MRVALPLPPLPFGAARQIERIVALQHHAFDRLGVLACAGTGWIAPCSRQRLPAIKVNGWRQVSSLIAELCHKIFEPPPAFRKWQRAKVAIAVPKQIVSAQVNREFLDQLG